MAETTNIEWADSTFNPVWGCTKISPACNHCYASVLDKRTGGNHWGKNPRRRTSAAYWKNPLKWQRDAAKFFAIHGRRRRVFCASMADVFDNQWDPQWRVDLWNLIRACPDLDWLILTKRPQNIKKMLPPDWGDGWDNVWLGTTVENQEVADRNIPTLLSVPARIHFLSCEPLLGPLNIPEYLPNPLWNGIPGWNEFEIDWVIAGGESGPGARPSHPGWFRSLRDQCAAADVPFLFKQWGEWGPDNFSDRILDGKALCAVWNWFDWSIVKNGYVPDLDAGIGEWAYRLGKKVAGRLLDGVEHNRFPG